MADDLTVEKNQEILQHEIKSYVKNGFRVISQTETTAQLLKPKNFSLLWAVFWFLIFVFGLIIYLFYYLAKRDDQIYIEVTATGKVITRET
jgi:hypothetical protein